MARCAKMNVKISYNKQLISKVVKNVELYDTKNEYYFDKTYQENIWEMIAKNINSTPSVAKRRWKYLRMAFLHEHQRILKNENPSKPKWSHYDQMLFLVPYINRNYSREIDEEFTQSSQGNQESENKVEDVISNRILPSNSGAATDTETVEKVTMAGSKLHVKKSRKQRAMRKTRPNRSNLKRFINSMYKTMKRIPPENQIKVGIAALIEMVRLEEARLG